MFEYVGALHMHSTFSDGSGTVEEIVKFAGEVGLDFIALTDHNTMRALKEGYEGWYGNTLLVVGCEINDRENKNHYLAFGVDKAYSTRLSAKEYVNTVKEAGGIGFLAHPHEKRNHLKEHPPYPWVDWDIDDFTGMEIWNHMSEWMENLTEENKYQSFLHPLRTIEKPPEETLKKWDELNQERLVVGIGGVDAHAHKYNMLGFFEVEIFPYKVMFKSIRTHVLLRDELTNKMDPAEAKKKILGALEKGSCFVANDYHGDSRGFRFYAKANGRIYNMGETIFTKDKVTLNVLLPLKTGEIRLIHNGETVDHVESGPARFVVDQKGVYRVEVFAHKKAWIYSNPVRIYI